MDVQLTLWQTQEEKHNAICAAPILVAGVAPKTIRSLKRLLCAIAQTPSDIRIAEILAAKMDVGLTTYHRLLAMAKRLELVVVTERPGDASLIEINWGELRRLTKTVALPKEREGYQKNGSPTKKMVALPFSNATDSRDGNTRAAETYESQENRHADCDAGAGAMNVMNGWMNDSLEDSKTIHPSIHPIPSSSAARHVDQPQQPQRPSPARGGGLGPGGWPEKITRDHLRTVAKIQELFDFAKGRTWVTDDDREGFFALAGHIGMSVKEEQNPGGKFTQRVKVRDWQAAPCKAWEAARIAIKRLDADLAKLSEDRTNG